MSNIKNAHIQGNLTLSANTSNVGDHGSGILLTDYIQETTSNGGIQFLNSNLDLYSVGLEQTQLRLTNDLTETSQLLLNGSANVSGNGIKSFTIINNSGSSYIQSKGGIGIKIIETSGNVTIQSSTESINSTTAALVVTGGVSINKSIIVDREIRGNDGYHLLYNTTTAESVLQIENTSTGGYSAIDFKDSSDTLRLQIGYGNSTSSSPLTSQAYIQSSSGSLLLRSNNTDSMLLETDGSVEFKHSTASTNYTSGAITSLGGIAISNTTDATGIGNGGALSIAGGTSIAKKLFVGTDVNLAVNSGITTIGSSTPVTISATGILTIDNNTSIGNSNSFTGTGGSLNIDGDITLYNATKNTIAFRNTGIGAPSFTTRSNGTKILLWPNLSGSAVDYGIGVESNSIWFSIPDTSASLFYYWYGGTTRNMSLSGSGALSLLISNSIGNSTSFTGTGGSINTNGDITLYNATKNTIAFRGAGVAAPSFTTRSAGTKILLWPSLSGSNADFAIGIETLGIWQSVPGTSQKFYWYSGTTEIMRLDSTSTGILNINGTTASTSNTTGSIVTPGGIGVSNTTDATSSTNGGSITTAGGLAVAKKVFIGTNLDIGSFFQMYPVSTPTNPSSGQKFYIDTSDGGFKSINSTGVVKYYNPNTTKGDLVTHNGTTDSRLSVGTTNQILYADPALPNGIGWKNLSSETPIINPNISKYFEAYNSSNTTLTDSYTNIILDTIRTTDVDYFSYNANSELTILSSGTYMIIGKLTVENTTGNDETYASLLIQKGVSNSYSDLPGTLAYCFSYTLNQSPICSCTTSCIVNLNENDQIRLRMKRENVEETLRTYPNSCNLVVVRVFIDETDDNTTYFNTYKTSNQTLTGSFTDILLQTNRIIDSSYSHTSGSAEITFNESGIYFINMNIGFTKTSGTDYTETETELSLSDTAGLNYATVPASLNYSYLRRSGSYHSSVAYCILNITSGQHIKIRSRILTGSNVNCLTNTCQINITKYQSTTNGQANVKFVDIYNTGTQVINSSYTDITYDTQRIINGIYTHTGGTAPITVGETGKYIIFAKAALNNTNVNVNNNTSTQMRILLDTGGGYSAISGHLSSTVNVFNTAGKSTLGLVLTLSLSAGSSLKIQIIKLYSGSTVQTLANSTSFSIIKVEPEEQATESILKFGTQYTYVESSGLTSTTSTTYIQKLRLTTGLVPEGYYRVGCFFIVYPEVSNNDINIQLILDTSTTLQETIESRTTASRQASYIFKQIQLSAGIHNIDLNFSSTTGSLVYIKDARIELWRLF